jgi:hypothetical protein
MGKTETISPKVRNKTRELTLSSPINIVLEFLSRAVRQERRNKRNTNR